MKRLFQVLGAFSIGCLVTSVIASQNLIRVSSTAASTTVSNAPTVVSVPPTAVSSTPEVKPVVASLVQSVPFEALSYCDQLDSINKAGKPVATFITEAANAKGYLHAVDVQCKWHGEQATVARSILYPPVIEVPTTVVRSTRTVTPNSDADFELPASDWVEVENSSGEAQEADDEWEAARYFNNDCDGVKEPGERNAQGRCHHNVNDYAP